MNTKARYQKFPILMVEDNLVARKVIEKMLKKAGYKVVSVNNGREALEVFSNQFFPIVLTDWMMPEIDGLELCRRIRQMSGIGYVFIVLLTARDSKEDIITGLEAGADDFLTKPVNPPELMARLSSGIRILELEQSLMQANEEIRLLSIQDTLTKCYNRSYLNERLPNEIKRAQRYNHPLAIILSDIDYFKRVNDTHGHQAGDMVLREFARRLRSSIRDGADWVVRYGGEEFLIVLPETNLGGAYYTAERLRNVVSKFPLKLANNEISITASFGVAGCDTIDPQSDISLEKAINQADRYLYMAKKEGRNRVVAGPLSSDATVRQAI